MTDLFTCMERRIHRLSIRTKVMLFSITLVLLSAAGIISILYLNISAGYRKQMQYSEDQSFLQAKEFIQYKVHSAIYASAVINYNNDIQNALSGSIKAGDSSSLQEQYRDMLQIEQVLCTVGLQEYVFSASIYVPSTLFYAKDNMYFSSLDDIRDTDFYRDIVEEKMPLVWLPPQEVPMPNQSTSSTRMVSMLRPIRSPHDSSVLLAIQRVSILADDFDSILKKSDITQQGVVFLSNSKNQLISCSNEETYEKMASSGNQISEVSKDWTDIKIDRERFLHKSSSIPDTDWILTAIIPYREITSQSRHVGFIMLCLMGVIGAIACICSYLFAESLTSRLRFLTGKMDLVQNGDLTVRANTDYEDEIGYLYCSFNYMTKQLEKLVKEQYNSGKAVKNAELKALQAQINPHFLYNTLDLINWEALDHNSLKISRLTQALAKFYRLSLSKGKNMVSLHDELEHVKAYVLIQNYRFDNRICLNIQVPEELMDCQIIKLVLQPLVENSILHGQIGSKFIESGYITISGIMTDNVITLQVADNGIGMEESQLDGILKVENSHSGYGLCNIDQRFKLCYGESYGLSFQSLPNAGTTVFVRFPVKIDDGKL